VNLLLIILIGIGVAMDASAVAVTDGMVERQIKWQKALFIALTFSMFQGVMPVIGYYFGCIFTGFIHDIAHYLSFVLLSFLGGRLIYQALTEKETSPHAQKIETKTILLQGFATSIDALLVGLTFALSKVKIYRASLIIVLITFVLSFISVYLGCLCGWFLKDKAKVLGGLILLAIAIRVLIEGLK